MPHVKRALYAGSFDPMTFGHLSLIQRGARIVDELVVAVAQNTSKNAFFSSEERIEILKEATGEFENVRVDSFQGLLVEYARNQGVTILLRGLRSVNDFQYEFQMALTNKDLWDEIDTVFLATEGKYAHVASSLIREIASMGGSVSGMVPELVEQRMVAKVAGRG